MILMTYPRTGVNFLQESIKFKTDITVEFTHGEFTKQKDIVNIVRDPKESMVSWISMMDTYGDEGIENNTFDNLIKVIVTNKYLKMYKFLLSKETIFINYKDLNKIDDVVKYLCNKLKLEVVNDKTIDPKKIHDINHLKEGGYLVTSKDTMKYNTYKEKIETIDLSDCYELYYKALNRCIKL